MGRTLRRQEDVYVPANTPPNPFQTHHTWQQKKPTSSNTPQTVKVGITAYAAAEIGDITWVELPEPATEVAATDPLCAIESVKAANDIYAPMSGTVVEANTAVEEVPGLVNRDPEGEGWIAKLETGDVAEWESLGLLGQQEYDRLVKGLVAEKE
jgi:glycine cleavage system H protein